MLRSNSGISRCIKYRLCIPKCRQVRHNLHSSYVWCWRWVFAKWRRNIFINAHDDVRAYLFPTGKRRVYTENKKNKTKKKQHQKRVLAADSRSKNCDGPCCEFAYHSTSFKYSTIIHFGTCVALPLFSLIFLVILQHTHTERGWLFFFLGPSLDVRRPFFLFWICFIFIFYFIPRAPPESARFPPAQSRDPKRSVKLGWLAGRQTIQVDL